MKRQHVFILVTANLAVLILLTVLWPGLMVAPGHVMPAHRSFEADCFACGLDHKSAQDQALNSAIGVGEVGRTSEFS